MVKKVNLCLVLMVCTVLLLTGQAQAVIISTSGSGIVFDSGGFEAETVGTAPSNPSVGSYLATAWTTVTDAATAGIAPAWGSKFVEMAEYLDQGTAYLGLPVGGSLTTGTVQVKNDVYVPTQSSGDGLIYMLTEAGNHNDNFGPFAGFADPIDAISALGLTATVPAGHMGVYYYDGAYNILTTGGGTMDMAVPFDAWAEVQWDIDLDAQLWTLTVDGITSDPGTFRATGTALDSIAIHTNVGSAWDAGFFVDNPKPPAMVMLDIEPVSLTVYEDPLKGPQSDTFTVAIAPDPNVAPGQVVTIVVDPNGLGDGDNDVTVNPGTLTFTNADWDIPQTVTVTAIGNDDVCDGGFEEIDWINLKVSAVGGDPNDFVGAGGSVAVSILDFGCANIVISKTTVSVVEGGAGDSYTISMTMAPSGDVVVEVGAVGLDPQDPNLMAPLTQVTVNGQSRDSLTFTTANWETPQTVTVAAVDDGDPEADPHTAAIRHRVTQSAGDQEYDGYVIPFVSAVIAENDCGYGPFNEMDFNHDCRVDLKDLAAFALEWLTCSGVYLCN